MIKKLKGFGDYEYKTKTGKIRVEKQESDYWAWRYFGNDGSYESSNQIGEAFKLKREAKKDGIEYAAQQ